jgi:hypothetical protein
MRNFLMGAIAAFDQTRENFQQIEGLLSLQPLRLSNLPLLNRLSHTLALFHHSYDRIIEKSVTNR